MFISILLVFFSGALVFGIVYAWRAFPIITGFGSKVMCSCMSVGGRNEHSIRKEELGVFPFTLANYKVDRTGSSVTGSILGMAKRKAVYREGWGCTLVNDFSEASIRQEHFPIVDPPAGNADAIPWPDGDLVTDAFPDELDRNVLDKAVDAAFKEPDPKKNARTRAVVVLYDGQMVAEKYAGGFNRHSRMHGWSVAKSVNAALVGILVRQGKLQLNDPAPIEEWKNDARSGITIRHLLQQTSGLDFQEDYASVSEVTNMLFNKGDMAGYAIGRPLKYQPGTTFNYSSGNSNILSGIIRKTVGLDSYPSFPYRELFYKTGMRSAILEPDASGTFVASSYVFATARDYARFGLLYYNNGKWNNEQLLPESWVTESRMPPKENTLKNYGYQFWLKGFDQHPPHQPDFPDVASDLYYADGYGYQDIYIIPSEKLVVVRLGLTLDHSFDENAFLKSIRAAIKK